VRQHIQAGKLRALDVTGAKRSSVRPDVPTTTEAGVTNVDVSSRQSLVGSKGLPAAVRSKFHFAVVAAHKDPPLNQQIVAVGLEVVADAPAQFAAFPPQEFARWKTPIASRKITAD
jgi:tripartite-type tricarboxylate transporter receptor subunit TctC